MDSELNGVFIGLHAASLDDALNEGGLLGLLELGRNEGVRFGVHWQRCEGCPRGVKSARVVKLQRTHI